MKGPILYVQVRQPADKEIDECIHLHLTEYDIEWDPECWADKFKSIHSNNVISLEDDLKFFTLTKTMIPTLKNASAILKH